MVPLGSPGGRAVLYKNGTDIHQYYYNINIVDGRTVSTLKYCTSEVSCKVLRESGVTDSSRLVPTKKTVLCL